MNESGELKAAGEPKTMGAGRWRHGKLLIVVELVVFAAVYVADWRGHVFLSKVPYLFALAWVSLRLRKMRWRDVGFYIYKNRATTLAIGIAAGIGMELLELFCTQPLLARMFGTMPDLSVVDNAGNLKWLMVYLMFTWTLFAFGEEMIFRGYLMNRITDLVGRKRSGWAVALVGAGLIFGLSHFQQGVTGVSENVVDGLILGGLYLVCGRNLAVPIVAHGVTDTVDFLLIYFHRYPGL